MRGVIAGFAAIISLVFITAIISTLRENYNHFQQSFSELGELHSPYYLIFNFFAFILPGTLIFYSMGKIYQPLELRKSDVNNLRIASMGWVITGVFPLSYSISWLYWIHIFGAFVAFIFGPLGIIMISSELSNHVEWGYFSIISTTIAFLSWASILLFDLYFHAEMAQLITIGLFFFWYFL
ncbi:MAG: DUF998 domain-containing protein, partial [Candidatus Kariarchaeaceae archaeon]